MEDFKRPDHPDFKLKSELKKDNFSGLRHNSLSDYMEIWVDGEVKAELPVVEVRLNPEKWHQMYSDVFGLNVVETNPLKGN